MNFPNPNPTLIQSNENSGNNFDNLFFLAKFSPNIQIITVL